MRRLLIVRHGQSVWNMDSKFTGWTNIPLTEKGEQEAKSMAQVLNTYKWTPKVIFTSALERSVKTCNIIKQEAFKYDVPTLTTWRLNEKHYGQLEGIEREYIRELFGKEFTKKMRTNYHMLPPTLRELPSRIVYKYPVYRNQYYESISNGESKEDVFKRVIPYYIRFIEPAVSKGDTPLIVTHKHTARVIMKYIQNMNDDEFESYNIPNNKIMSIIFDESMKFRSITYCKY